MSIPDVKIKILGQGDMNDVMHRKRARRIWEDLGGFEKSQLRTRLQTGRVDFRGSLRPDEFARYGRSTRWETDGKAIIERLCLSPYVKTFKLKGNKMFRWYAIKTETNEIIIFYLYV